MPSATENDKTSLDAASTTTTSIKSKMSRNSVDHLKTFEVAVFQYKEDSTEKNLANVEKILQVTVSKHKKNTF